jgi:hypothetical protein
VPIALPLRGKVLVVTATVRVLSLAATVALGLTGAFRCCRGRTLALDLVWRLGRVLGLGRCLGLARAATVFVPVISRLGHGC